MGTKKQPRTHDPVVDEYSKIAKRYDTKWSFYVKATTRETMLRLSVGPADRVLDVGCGTGVLLAELARAHAHASLAGVDAVNEMLSIARRRLPPAVDLRQGWAQQLPWEDASFDVVVSCNMFHYIRQLRAALAEMARVLRRGGRLVITDWCGDFLACRACDWYLRIFRPAHLKVYRQGECLDLLKEVGHCHATWSATRSIGCGV